MKTMLMLFMIALLAAPTAIAETYNVEIIGMVEFNLINDGPFAEVMTGDEVLIEFTLDSEAYLDSETYPTRGYVIDMMSYWLHMGAVTVGLQEPYPDGMIPYFVLRNNDPAVDGFFISNGVDWPSSLPVNEMGGIDPYFGSVFSVGYGEETLDSLEIADAVGTYDYDGLTNFYFGVIDGPVDVIGFEFTQLVISGGGVAVEAKSLSQVKSLFH